MNLLSRIWPWSQITLLQHRLQYFTQECHLAEDELVTMDQDIRDLRVRLAALSRRAAVVQEANTKMMVENANANYELVMMRKKLDDSEQALGDAQAKIKELQAFIDGSTPKEVLYPPELAPAPPIQEPIASWPFPTSARP